jgi:hypothetical protein
MGWDSTNIEENLFNYIFSHSVVCILVFSGQMKQNPADGGLKELDLALMVQRDTPAELAKYYTVWSLINRVEMVIFYLGQGNFMY